MYSMEIIVQMRESGTGHVASAMAVNDYCKRVNDARIMHETLFVQQIL
jgi:hypothetical protein